MGRKSPRSHVVHKHERKGKSVNDFNRGKGDHRKASISEIKLLAKKGTIDEQGRALKAIGEDISFTDNHKRVSGIVVGIRSEYYLVERKGKIWKVDRHSPFSRIGEALKGGGAKLLLAGKAGLAGAAKATSAGISRRIDERRNWKAWEKEMEQEEKEIFEREKAKVKRQDKVDKFRKKIREGPKWRRTVRVGKFLAKEKTSQAQKKALISVVGKKRAENIIAAINRARKEESKPKTIAKIVKKKRKLKTISLGNIKFSAEEKRQIEEAIKPSGLKLSKKEREELK